MKRRDGFTLLEVMVATAILAVGLSAVSGGLSMAARSTALASGYERAHLIAQSRLEQFLSTRPDTETRTGGTDEGLPWQLVAETDPDLPGILRIRVQVSFFAAGERTLTLETREADRRLPEQQSNPTTADSK